MSDGSLAIVGFSSGNNVPMVGGETVFGAGPIGAGDIPLKGLCVGLKLAASGSLVDDVSVVQARSYNECDALAGAGSELACMGYRFLDRGISPWLASVTPSGSGVAGSATITVAFASGTAPVTVGTWVIYAAGVRYSGSISLVDTVTTIATAMKKAILANPRARVTASNSSGVLTITDKVATVRGAGVFIYQDKSGLPSNITSVLAGGTAVNTDGAPLTSGAGVEDVTAILAVLATTRYHRIAWAQQDATNLALIETASDTKAGPLVGMMEHSVVAFNAAMAAATSIAQTTLNTSRFQCAHMLTGESPACEIAAAMAALRLDLERDNPNSRFDGLELVGIAPGRYQANQPSYATKQSALENSVTPIETVDGKAVVVRAITTKSLLGSSPDYRTYDVPEAVVPDFVREDLALDWTTEFNVANPYVRADAAAEEPEPPGGVATPSRWNARVTEKMLGYQALNYVTAVELNPPQSEYNTTAKRIDSAVPVIVLPHQHSIGISVRQFNL